MWFSCVIISCATCWKVLKLSFEILRIKKILSRDFIEALNKYRLDYNFSLDNLQLSDFNQLSGKWFSRLLSGFFKDPQWIISSRVDLFIRDKIPSSLRSVIFRCWWFYSLKFICWNFPNYSGDNLCAIHDARPWIFFQFLFSNETHITIGPLKNYCPLLSTPSSDRKYFSFNITFHYHNEW